MPLSVEDVTYYTLTEVAERVDRARETIWRWIRAEKVPRGRRYRNRERLFTEAEIEEIYAHAHRIEPIEGDDPGQLRLFNQ